ncbi:MAG: glycosyltransferase [Candidatus Obscuribacterales bacterium]|nr:glycosyltransferase [Candidatus Obscuribacterales bacterium]
MSDELSSSEELSEISSKKGSKWLLIAFILGLFASAASAFIAALQVQIALSLLILLVAFLFWRVRHKEIIRRLLMAISILATTRYIVWRALFTLNLPDPLTGTLSIVLFLAELYTVYSLIGFYFQIYSLDRSAENIQPIPEFQPTVDIFIPTYNEDVDILRRTAVAALNVDYENKKVYILDDGTRDSMKALAAELNCGYIVREKHLHAKAGNINNALKHSSGELVLILDADHIPMSTILSKLVPFFKDEKVSLVQSPHRFMNPGPIERNVHLAGKLPFEQELFMQIVQVGNDFWNAAFFCGSAALLRRSVLEEIGGIATETVTEDCHTSIRMHALGYKSRYFPVPQIIGLSPESVSGFIIQHCRWARGATQMLRIEMPPFKKGLSWPQKLCYLNGMTHFLFGIPRLIFYAAPIAFIVFHQFPVKTNFLSYMVMGISYILCSIITNNYFLRNFRHTFWSDIYEAVLAPFYAVVTTQALFDPKSGKFNVTPKGTMTDQVHFDREIAMPNILILIILLFTFGYGCFRAAMEPELRVALCVNVFWTFYNIMIVGIAVLCTIEQTFTRRAHRVRRKLDVIAKTKGGQEFRGSTVLTNEFGSLLRLKETPLEKGEIIDLQISGTVDKRELSTAVQAEIRYIETASKGEILLGLQYRDPSPASLEVLILLSYCEAKTWEELLEPEDEIGRAAWDLASTPARVAIGTQKLLDASRKEKERKALEAQKKDDKGV